MQRPPDVREIGLANVYQYRFVWMTLKNNVGQPDIRVIWLEDVHQYQYQWCRDRKLQEMCINIRSMMQRQGVARGCISISDLFVCIDPLWMILKNEVETARLKGRLDSRMSIIIKPICLHRLTLMPLKNDADTARCKGDRISGCVTLSDLFVCTDPLKMT